MSAKTWHHAHDVIPRCTASAFVHTSYMAVLSFADVEVAFRADLHDFLRYWEARSESHAGYASFPQRFRL